MIYFFLFITSFSSLAAGKKPLSITQLPSVSAGKKLIQIEPLKKVVIELPDQEKRDFGYDYWMRLSRNLDVTRRYVLYSETGIREGQLAQGGTHVWSGKQVPAVILNAELSVMSFVTGSRGTRMFYGFDENNPRVESVNEFPIQSRNQAAAYFTPYFDAKGDAATGTLAGLDLGEGMSLDVVFAFLKVKYATYRARMRLDLNFTIPTTGQAIQKKLDVNAKGYFYDVAGGYFGYSAELAFARKDAWLKSFEQLVRGSQESIESMIAQAPLTAVINEIVNTELGKIVYLGTGVLSDIPVGTLYTTESHSHVFEVIQSVPSGSVGVIKSGDPASVYVNMVLREWSPEALLGVASLTQLQKSEIVPARVDLESKNIEKIKFNHSELDLEKRPNIFQLAKLFLTIPYRVWRYFSYDQKLKSEQSVYKGEPLVAVIDSGVDYNAEEFRNHIWIDPQGGEVFYGYDFVSGDPRAYGDHEHGTQSARQALSSMREGKIMPIKTHNPWGVTRSDILMRAMRFAVDHGAKVVLTNWSTIVSASAFQQMAEYARANDVLWVTALGNGKNYPALLSSQFDNMISEPDSIAAEYSGRAAQARADHPTWSAGQVKDYLSK